MTVRQEVFVETAARLHFGVLDLRGELGRWFGGLGAAAPAPTLLLSARPAASLEVLGEDRDRAEAFARRFLEHHGLGGARILVHRALPQHAGLGSGTQLALAVGRALAELHGITGAADELARVTGRGCRSAVGTWTFAGGGFVVEGGRYPDRNECGPLLVRLPFPTAWRCVVALPDALPGINGTDEEEAFAQLPPPPEREVQRVSHLVLMALLPALSQADLQAFGAALNEIQEITGGWFASVQGGTFMRGPSADLVRKMAGWGAVGVGQSSWGPAVYGIVEGEDTARHLVERVSAELGESGSAYHGAFRAEGARVWRAPTHAGAPPALVLPESP